ncbi:hypothetical protein AGMMS50239_41110 [Bacteroidia bacterium]|nr:hypothetical protein AGMMS50239_41110 [Bacteroidia bacterium]
MLISNYIDFKYHGAKNRASCREIKFEGDDRTFLAWVGIAATYVIDLAIRKKAIEMKIKLFLLGRIMTND